MYKAKIESMNCMSCFHNIENALKVVDSSVEASADLKERNIEIKTSLSSIQVVKLIEQVGYEVNDIGEI